MPDRRALHQLVDALPEAALESMEHGLRSLHALPERRARVQELMQRAMEQLPQKAGRNATASGFASFSGRHSIAMEAVINSEGDGVATASGSQGRSEVNTEIRRFRGHELRIEKRLSISDDERNLHYALCITSPAGKEGRWEIDFDIPGIGKPPVQGHH